MPPHPDIREEAVPVQIGGGFAASVAWLLIAIICSVLAMIGLAYFLAFLNSAVRFW
jgi:hypothetical protein